MATSRRFKLTRLDLTWSVSKGQDTYGYNIARLDDATTGKRYRCMGGGYDMIGTVFGEFMQDVYQLRLLQLCEEHKAELIDCGYQVKGYLKLPNLYGMNYKDGKVTLDGGCGISSMISIAQAIGLEITRTGNRKGHTTGFIVSEPDGPVQEV